MFETGKTRVSNWEILKDTDVVRFIQTIELLNTTFILFAIIARKRIYIF